MISLSTAYKDLKYLSSYLVLVESDLGAIQNNNKKISTKKHAYLIELFVCLFFL